MSVIKIGFGSGLCYTAPLALVMKVNMIVNVSILNKTTNLSVSVVSEL